MEHRLIERFELLSEITDIERIATGSGIRLFRTLVRKYGNGNWRKLKGVADVRLVDGTIWVAEVHWYECHGIGRRGLKIKNYLKRL